MKRLLDTEVRYFDQNTFEIPKLLNTWGCKVDLLDCALVTGNTPQQVLSSSVSEDEDHWLFTLTLNIGHGFKKNLSVVRIKESFNVDLNGLHRVQEITPTSIVIALLKSDLPNKPLNIEDTLGMTIALEPLGYEIVFQEPQKRVYKTANPLAKQAYLRVDNSCPPDYDPSWAKLSRISMFSEIDGIDDFRFRLGRLKAPCWEGNYDAVEDKRNDVWMASRSRTHSHSFPIKTTSGHATVPDYFIIGDSKTFYISLKNVLYYDNVNGSDLIYTFGEYSKYMYKEDPLPFLLNTTLRHNNDDYMWYENKHHFSRDSYSAKYLFNTDFNFNFTSQTHQNWVFWLNDSFRSGANTRINFRYFKNELAYNLFPKNIRTSRLGATIMEGYMRGMYDFMCNLQDMPVFAPQHGEVISADTFYITVESDDYDLQGTKYAFKLSNWE